MNLYYDFRIDSDAVDAEEVINRLNLLDIVEIAYAPSESAPFADILPVTPDFSFNQGYLDSAASGGIGARNIWPLTKGSGVKVRQMEFNWITGHEDVNQNLLSGVLCLNQPDYVHHGTAVAGIISGLENGYGITGIAPEANFARVSFCTSCRYVTPPIPIFPPYYACDTDSFVNVLSRTLQQSIPGDIINVSAGNNTVPYESESGEYDAVRQAVLEDGRIVVLAAGNSDTNLDDVVVGGYNIFNREYRDSGAIFVGAGTPDTNHMRVVNEPTSNGLLWSSNYGNRLDLQGWGKSVTTTGGSQTTNSFDGDLFNGGGDINQYYTSVFDGTSAAAPIVSGAAALVQSYFKNQYNNYLRPLTLRALLKNTGTPQGSDATSAPIGPLPNAERAINFQLPTADVKPDGTGNQVEIGYGEQITVTYSVSPRDFDGAPADWWLIICYNSTCQSLDKDGNWPVFMENGNTVGEPVPMRTDLLETTGVVLYSGNGLSVGDYGVYFGTDIIQDGHLTDNLLSYDYVLISVR